MKRCVTCKTTYAEPCDTCGRGVCDEHSHPFGVFYDGYSGGYEASGFECTPCHAKRQQREERERQRWLRQEGIA